ncbi:MAG TPA: class I SAM-dependent methyltransferase [Mycobacteriales bacterium]|nr:class I SAM-dependent methyltransferase [Mycobacteriales bacterium]
MTSAPGPRSAALAACFAQHHPLFKHSVAQVASAGDEASVALEETLAHLCGDDEALRAAAAGYAAFALDAMRRERRFETDPSYPVKSFAETADDVYLDEAFMARTYLPGLLLSHHLWAHQRAQLAFFEQAFMRRTAATAGSAFVEVGLGTGLYSRRLLQLRPDARVTGYDISPAAVAFARAHIAAFGLSDRFRAELRDALAEPPGPGAHLVCVEVLEHLEDPPALLTALRVALAPQRFAFITTALNAPNVDHIYLYRRPSEVEAQLMAAGFTVDDAFAADAYPPRRPGLPVPSLAAYVVH